jgi:hypothetical protein
MTKEEAIEIFDLVSGNSFYSDELKIIPQGFWEALKLAIAIMKADPDEPDWSISPKWANHFAIDGDGTETWFANEPEKVNLSYEAYSGSWRKNQDPKNMKLFKRPELKKIKSMKPLVKFAKPSTNIHGTKTLLKLIRNRGQKKLSL